MSPREAVGRCANTRSPISVDQIKEWCGNPDAQITIKPIIDLNEHIHVEAYEAAGPAEEPEPSGRRALCVPALHQAGGTVRHRPRRPLRQPRSDQLRQHRAALPTPPRAKTHSAWDYSVLDRGTYLWTTPNGLQLIRDHTGTHEP